MAFPAQPNQSIIRGFLILQEVIGLGRPSGSREISRLLDMEHSSVNRILGTLAATGFLVQDMDKKYLPGPRIHVLSALSLNASQVIPASLPVLQPFHDLGAVVALGSLWRETVVYFLHAKADQDLAHSVGVHENYPANKSVIGTVLAPGGPTSTFSDRPQVCERAWGARVSEHENIGIAIVLPIDHPRANPPEVMQHLAEEAANEICRNLLERRWPSSS